MALPLCYFAVSLGQCANYFFLAFYLQMIAETLCQFIVMTNILYGTDGLLSHSGGNPSRRRRTLIYNPYTHVGQGRYSSLTLVGRCRTLQGGCWMSALPDRYPAIASQLDK